MSDLYKRMNQQKIGSQANKFSSPNNDRSRGNGKERSNPIVTHSAKYTTSSLTSSFAVNRRLMAQRSDQAYDTPASKPKKNIYSNLILNGNSMNQSKKPYAPNQTFTRKGGSDHDFSKGSIVSENEILSSKMGPKNQKNLNIIDANKTHSGGSFYNNVGNKISKVTSNSSSKSQLNSQFFGQRNSKNVKYKQESLKNPKRSHPNEQNFTKMKINQRVERETSKGSRKPNYYSNDNDLGIKGTYPGSKQITTNK